MDNIAGVIHNFYKRAMPFIIRNTIITVIGCGILIFIDYIVVGEYFSHFLRHGRVYALVILGYIVASEGTLFIDNYLTRKLSSKLSITNVILWKFSVVLLFYSVLYLVFYFLISPEPFARKTQITILISIIYVILIDLILIVNRFRNRLQEEREINSRLKEEKLKSDLYVLQNQLNPHFFFNSLNVLVSEIYEDTEKAVKYIEQLSNIFRYILQSSESFTVPVQKELEFLTAFIYLYKVRHGDALVINIDKELQDVNAEVPPMVLQMLVENCLKHNEIQRSNPLIISIRREGDFVLVENNLIKKSDAISTTTGLRNIRRRYSLLQNMDIYVEETPEQFCVKVPLIY
jgi:sensor histidine kinase YesM